MTDEELNFLRLSRLGKEKVIKYGTYDLDAPKAIIQDHPFYAKQEPIGEPEPSASSVDISTSDIENEADANALASQIISNNFKVGLSQEEVDALLNGMI